MIVYWALFIVREEYCWKSVWKLKWILYLLKNIKVNMIEKYD